ncbi:MAG TPA: hypothetical protein VEM95_00225 [Thermoplasmata archaeon]|nr:hypothetical protein [Thermoplasmata archaeon]
MKHAISQRIRLKQKKPAKAGIRASIADMPVLARTAGQLVQASAAGEMLEVKAFKPKEIASEKLIAHTLRISTDYLVGYVEGLAREDPASARTLAEKLEVPLVRTMTKGEGKTKEFVEIVSVAEYFRRYASEVGELASHDVLDSLEEKG